MMLRVALLLAVLAALVEGEGEPTELCPRVHVGDEELVTCQLPGDVRLKIKVKPSDYVEVTCEGAGVSSLRCGALPHLKLAHNSTWSILTMYSCPGAVVGCAPGALGAGWGGARTLRLEMMPGVGALADELDWSGLDALESLVLYWNGEPTEDSPPLSVPTAALTSLPQLRKLSISGARLALNNDSFRDSHLQHLELTSGLISSLPRGMFLPLGNLTNLYMWDNRLDNLSADALQGLSSLERLSLDQNPLSSLAGVFRHTPLLRELSLKSTTLLDIDESTFQGLRHLQELYIANSRRPLSPRPRALAALPALHTLVLENCSVARLPADLLAGSAALLRLDMSLNKLTTLPEDLFTSQTKLDVLILKNNQLSELPGELLWPLRELRILRLDHNKLKTLPNGMLDKAGKLQKLSVSNNMLLSLSDALRGASSLSLLDLSNNKLTLDTEQPKSSSYSNLEVALDSVRQLQTLNLSHNHLRVLPQNLVLLMTRLRTVDVSDNNLTALSSIDLGFVSDNVTLNLQHNHISRVNLDPTTSSVPNPVTVLLDHNPFTCDCHLYSLLSHRNGTIPFFPELNLKVDDANCSAPIDLYQRPLKNLRPEELTCDWKQDCAPGCQCILRPATKGMELSCNEPPDKYPGFVSHNDDDDYDDHDDVVIDLRLKNLPLDLASLPSFIRSLDLSSLNITTPPTKVPPTIKSIDLSNNRLEIPPLELLARNITVKLSGNPLACDCWHRSEMIQLQEYAYLVIDYKQLRCGADALHDTKATILCVTLIAASIGGTLAFIGLLTVILVALWTKYSLYIKVFLHSRGWCKSLGTKKLEGVSKKKYDAFVCYTYPDRLFVRDKLMPKLESKNYKLCVHHRDWIAAGGGIQDQITRSVELSLCTIIVLSRNFLDSYWAREEFRTAHTKVLRERRYKLIIILIEDVSGHKVLDDELKELKPYLATKSYFRPGEIMFWNKLVYAIPHRVDEDKSRKRGEEIPLIMLPDRPDVLVDKLGDKVGNNVSVLDARLKRDGKIVNTPALTAAGM